jgi:(p)ppGpp synthase/HD superfamily hydrolase
MTDDRETEAVPPALGERFDEALKFAAATHRLQRRKGSDVPYIGHLLGVCSLVIEDGGNEDEDRGPAPRCR